MNEALSEEAPATIGGQRRAMNRKRNRSIDIARGAALVDSPVTYSAIDVTVADFNEDGKPGKIKALPHYERINA